MLNFNVNFILQDSALSDGKIVIDVIDSIKPGIINYDLVKEGSTEEVSFILLVFLN